MDKSTKEVTKIIQQLGRAVRKEMYSTHSEAKKLKNAISELEKTKFKLRKYKDDDPNIHLLFEGLGEFRRAFKSAGKGDNAKFSSHLETANELAEEYERRGDKWQ